MAFQRIAIPVLSIALVLLAFPVYGQITSPCTSSMLTSLTPCMNYITNSSVNGTSPTADCCNVLGSFMSNGTGCLCLIATGSIPFNIPINRSLALSLPRACNMPGVPVQCKANVPSPPAPSPLASSPVVPPEASPSPAASNVPGVNGSPSLAPEAPTTPALTPPEASTTPALTPPAETTNSGAPTTNAAGSRQSVNPSSAASSTKSFSPLLVLALVGAIALKKY